MNPSKRAILAGAMDVIEQIAIAEEKDLRDQLDNIELDVCCDAFSANVVDLKECIKRLEKVISA